MVYTTPEREGVHIHRVAIDPYTNDWWITVGDHPVAGRVLYSTDHGTHWYEVACPKTGKSWQPYQPCNILFFEHSILIINEPLPQVFQVDKRTMIAEHISDIVDVPDLDQAPVYSAVIGTYGIYASIVSYPDQAYDAGIFVSYDKGYTWQQLVNFTAWAKKEDPSIVPSSVFGANLITFADGYIHANWVFWPWVETDSNIVVEGGWAFMIRDDYYLPDSVIITVNEGEITTNVDIKCNSVVEHPIFDQKRENIQFTVSSAFQAPGYCNITIPKTLLNGGVWMILIDDTPATDVIRSENATHSFLYFTYPPTTPHHILIWRDTSTRNIQNVIEISLALIPLVLMVSLITFIYRKRSLIRKLKPLFFVRDRFRSRF